MPSGMQLGEKIPSGLTTEKIKVIPHKEEAAAGPPLDFLTIVRTKPYASRMRKNSVFMRAASKLNLLEKVESHMSLKDDLGRS